MNNEGINYLRQLLHLPEGEGAPVPATLVPKKPTAGSRPQRPFGDRPRRGGYDGPRREYDGYRRDREGYRPDEAKTTPPVDFTPSFEGEQPQEGEQQERPQRSFSDRGRGFGGRGGRGGRGFGGRGGRGGFSGERRGFSGERRGYSNQQTQ